MKKVLTSAVMAMLACAGARAQELLIPHDYTETSPQELHLYEQNVLDCVEWLVNTPVDEQSADRQNVRKFVLEWIQATPNVAVYLDPQLMEFTQDSKYTDEMLTVYAGGYLSGLLRDKDTHGDLTLSGEATTKGETKADRIKGVTSAIETSLEFYDKNKDKLGRNNTLEKYKEMLHEGTLREHIESNIRD